MTIKFSILKQVDLFGRRTELSMNGQKSHKTWCGTFCTIFIIIACAISTIYYATEFFRRANPQYVISEIYDSQSSIQTHNIPLNQPFEQVQLGAKHFFAMIGLQDINYNLNDYTVDFTVFTMESVNGQIKGIKCSQMQYFQDMLADNEISSEKSFQIVKSNPDNFICLGGFENNSLPFIYDDQSRVEMRLTCSKDCDILNGQKLMILSSDYLVMPENFENPLQVYIMQSYIELSVDYINIVDVQLQKVCISTDYGYLLDDLQYQQQVTFRDFKRYNLNRNPTSLTDPLLIINIIPYSKQQIYNRDYPKLLTLVGIVGGLLKSLMVLGNFCTKPFSKLSMRSDLVNQLFTFEIKSEKKSSNIHEMHGYKDGEEEEEGEGTKKFVPRSKSMTLGKMKQQEGDANKRKKDQIDKQIMSTNIQTDNQLISVDSLKLQFQNTGQTLSIQQKTTPTIDTHNYLDTPINNNEGHTLINNNEGHTLINEGHTLINEGHTSEQRKRLYFRYPSTQSGLESSSINQHSLIDRQGQSNFQQDDNAHLKQGQSNVQMDDKYFKQAYEGQFDDQNTHQYTQLTDKRLNNIKLTGQFNRILGQKKESIIIHAPEGEQDHIEDFENEQQQMQTGIESTQQISPPVITPSLTFGMNRLDSENAASISTRSSLRKGVTNGLKILKHSHSQSDDIVLTELQRELEENNLKQRRNANFNREKKAFTKKEAQKNGVSPKQDAYSKQDTKPETEVDKTTSKKSSIKLQISKKETLKNQLSKKETLKKQVSQKENLKKQISKKETMKNGNSKIEQQQHNAIDSQPMSSSRRIKSFFSAKTKEITNLIRFNIQQRTKPTQSSNQSNNTNNHNNNNNPSGLNQNIEDKHNEETSSKDYQQAQLQKKNTHKQFDGILNEKQEKSIVLTIVDYVKYFVKCFKDTPKVKQMKYTNDKVKQRLDIIYILEKLIEIDKLKVLLLNPDQINLFDYMPKEFVSSNLEEGDNFDMFNMNNKFATWSLLCAERSQLDKYSNACIAYHHIQQNINKTKIDQKLIQMLDPQIKRYFNKTLIQPNDIKHYHSLLANYSMDNDEMADYLTKQQQADYLLKKQMTEQTSKDQLQFSKHSTPQQMMNDKMSKKDMLSFDNIQKSQIYEQNNHSTSLSPFHERSQQSKPSYIFGQDSTNGVQRLTRQMSSIYSPARQSIENQLNYDKSLQSCLLPERLNERKHSSMSPQIIYSNSPKFEVRTSPNLSDTDTLAMNILNSKRNNYISQKSKINTISRDYCWQAPIIEESNNMLSSEKFGQTASSQNIGKEQPSPKFYSEEKKSQILNQLNSSIIIQNEDKSIKNTNILTQYKKQNSLKQIIEDQENLHTEPANFTDNHDEEAIKDDNCEFYSLNDAPQISQIESPTKKSGFDVMNQIKNNNYNNQSFNLQQTQHTEEEELQHPQLLNNYKNVNN